MGKAKIVIVAGPPCSGKSTYVADRIKADEIVFDADAMRQAMTCREARDECSDAELNAIYRVRGIFPLIAADTELATVYIIATKPSQHLLDTCGKDAELVTMDVTKEECLKRLEADDTRPDKEAQKKKIERYFEEDESRMSKPTASGKMEIRSFNFEVRAAEDEQHGKYISGRAIVYDQPTDMGWYTEVIDDGALDQADLRDVRLLVNHNTDMIPLARSRNNNVNSTMQLSVVPHGGLDFRANLATEANADASSLYSASERGDITGMSFAFLVDKDEWSELDSDHPTRHIRSISKVLEISAVTYPAYAQTTLEARGLGGALDSATASLDSARAAAKKMADAKAKVKILCQI